MSAFNKIIEVTLSHEGGYVNDPIDKGGETKFGITKRNYPDLDIRGITRSDAIAIYKRDYWDEFKVDNLPAQYQHIYFDMLVNNGPRGAAKVMQRAIDAHGGTLVIDGVFGSKSFNQLCVYKPSIYTVRLYRVKFYNDIVSNYPNQVRFLHGWIKRALDV